MIQALTITLGTHRLPSKHVHEIRDPVHIFIRLDSDERRVLDSSSVQRLRHIHQLALSYLVYPGATHKRFEHSIGVMELAGRVFDVVTSEENIHEAVRDDLSEEISQQDRRRYWRKVLRMAALCHDIGHLPFSHAAEEALLPDGWNHERITKDVVQSDEMSEIWDSMVPPIMPKHVAKIAVGQEKMPDERFSNWEVLLSEIITGEAFGVDRMDYLLRDSHHTGVGYGRFDHHRLVDTLRILPAGKESDEPTLGVEVGGIHAAEALLLARYFMFKQVYLHSVRLAYDIHLEEFLKAWLPVGQFPTDCREHQQITDNDVLSSMVKAANNSSKRGHLEAKRILNREHYREVYSQRLDDKRQFENPAFTIADHCRNKFGKQKVRVKTYTQPEPVTKFPVSASDGNVMSSLEISETLQHLPAVDVGTVLVDPDIAEDTKIWLKNNRENILTYEPIGEEFEDKN